MGSITYIRFPPTRTAFRTLELVEGYGYQLKREGCYTEIHVNGFFVEDQSGKFYGPADLDLLTTWVQQGRIVPATVLWNETTGQTYFARDLPPLASLFSPQAERPRARNPFEWIRMSPATPIGSFFCWLSVILCLGSFLFGHDGPLVFGVGMIIAGITVRSGYRRGFVPFAIAFGCYFIWSALHGFRRYW